MEREAKAGVGGKERERAKADGQQEVHLLAAGKGNEALVL